jgi:hypothetical protein
MIEDILLRLWKRINKFSSRKYYPIILIPLARYLMLILSRGIMRFHQKEYDRIIAHHRWTTAKILIREQYWRYNRGEIRVVLDIDPYYQDRLGNGSEPVFIRGRWRMKN